MINPTPEVILLLFNVGDSLSMAAIQVFIYKTSCLLLLQNARGYDTWVCDSEAEAGMDGEQMMTTQKMAAMYLLIYRLVTFLPGILMMLLCGAWSDHVGRKLPIVLSKVCVILGSLCLLVATRLSPLHAVQLLLVGGAICGLSGHVTVVHMGIQSYVVDMTTERSRAHRMLILLGVNFLGRSLGNILAGILLQSFDFDIIFCVYMGITTLSLVTSVALLPKQSFEEATVGEESTPETPARLPRAADTLAIANIPRARFVADYVDFFRNPCTVKGQFYMSIYLVIGATLALCRGGQWDLFVLFLKRQPLLWKGSLYAYAMAVYFTSEGICGCLIVPLLSRIIRVHEVIILVQGLVSLTAAYILFGFSMNSWMVFLSLVIIANGISTLTALRALISKLVRPEEVAKAFSLLMAVEMVFTMLGALVFNGIYLATLHLLHGFTFFLLASVLLIVTVVVAAVSRDIMARWRHERSSLLANDSKPITTYGTEQEPSSIDIISDNEDEHEEEDHVFEKEIEKQEEIKDKTEKTEDMKSNP